MFAKKYKWRKRYRSKYQREYDEHIKRLIDKWNKLPKLNKIRKFDFNLTIIIKD
jgi:hypothetical protein